MAVKNKILIISGLICGLAALGTYVYRQYNLLYAYCYKFTKWNVVQLGINRVIIKPTLAIYNISDFGFSITSYKFDIYINNIFASKIYSDEKQDLISNGESLINFNIDFQPKKLFKNVNVQLILGLIDPSKMMVKFKGVVSIRSGAVSVRNVYIEMEDTLKNWLATDPDAEYVCRRKT